MTIGLALAASATVTCTSTSEIFPPIEFPQPPKELATDPSGAVVLSNVAEIAFWAPADEGQPGPREPYVVITQKVRALVTGNVHPSLSKWRVGRNFVTQVNVARARLARPDGTIAEIDGLATSSGDRPIVLSLPDPKPGDLIDIVTQRTLTAVEALAPWSFAVPAPCVESHLKVTAPESWFITIRRGQGDTVNRGAQIQQTSESGDRNGWLMVERNVRAVPRESGAPHPQRMAPWATVVLGSATVNGQLVKYADSWATVARRVKAMLAKTMALDEDSKQTMVRGLAKARLRTVRQALKPKGDQAGLFDRAVRPFAEIEVGTASAIETAAVAAAAMEGAVEKAYLALVAPFEGAVLIDDLPGLYAVRSAVLAFPSKGEWQFADPACMTCPFGKVPMAVAGGRAIVLADDGPLIVEIPLKIVEPNRRRLQFDWTLSVDGDVTGTLIADLEGFVAQEVYRAITFAEDDETQKRLVSALLFGPDSTARIDELVDESLLSPGQPYQLRFKVSAKAERKGEAAFDVSQQLLGGASFTWGIERDRLTDLLLPAPLSVQVTGTIRLPPDFSVKLPKAVKERMAFGKYSSKFAKRGRVITFSRRMGFFARNVSVERYPELRTFFDKAAAADAAVLVVRAKD